MDENDVQTISHKCEVLSVADFKLYEAGKKPKLQVDDSDVYYLAGTYDPTNGQTVLVWKLKHCRFDRDSNALREAGKKPEIQVADSDDVYYLTGTCEKIKINQTYNCMKQARS